MTRKQRSSRRSQTWVSPRNLILAVGSLAMLMGRATGLTTRHDGSPHTSRHASISSRSTCTPRPDDLKLPTPGTTWDYVLLNPIKDPSNIDTGISVWGIDLFDNSAASIATMKAKGANVICYFSAGSYEEWRPDASAFQPGDLGKDLDGWEGERWLDIRSQNVRDIMAARLDLAAQKGCDGVDPDNVDGFDNDNGLGLEEADSVDYVMFLANSAHERRLTLSLKNAASIIPQVIDCVDFSVNEQCLEYDECDSYAIFIDQGKPVFHVEYPKGDDVSNDIPVDDATKRSICEDQTAAGFSTIIKNIDLDEWIQKC